MGYEDFFPSVEDSQVKNSELKVLARFLHECAVNTAKEQSSGLTTGLDPHAIARQGQYLTASRLRAEALATRPFPDLPQTHPQLLECDISTTPDIIRDKDGSVLNDDILAVMEMWQRGAYELVKSNSAGLAGTLINYDHVRILALLDSIEQIVETFSQEALGVDFPETSAPDAVPGPKKKK